MALDDVVGRSAYDKVMQAVQLNLRGRGSPFDWEMRRLFEARLMPSADLWEAGAKIVNPFN
ncbi:hypothetical protein GCM10028820_17210 [Tessaracoccus terricola]